MFNTDIPLILDSHHLHLEISQSSQVSEQNYSTPGASRRAWINQLCLEAFLPWFESEMAPDAKVSVNHAALPSFWELFNGTPITFDNYRLVLIPTLAVDNDELRVPQEWVDIPEFAADYYIGVEVNPDDSFIKIFGYTTHEKLNNKGFLDNNDRTYSLESEDLIDDINVLAVAWEFNTSETLRAEITPLESIPQAQAKNFLERLGNSEVKFPRLEVPFSVWGSLIAQSSWQKKLYAKRQGLPVEQSMTQWLQEGITNLSQMWGWEKKEFAMASSGMRSSAAVQGLSKELIIADNTYELRIFPREEGEDTIWKFELRNPVAGGKIPAGFKLRLLTEDLEEFENNQDIAKVSTDVLYVEVILEPGEGLIWETEPVAEDWEREVLRF
ncbi:MAG: DUF1822 family protein [Rivularia sp. (in: Bacteria)]|nr:DUF1822 family protein [Rivularia sp. MS3]